MSRRKLPEQVSAVSPLGDAIDGTAVILPKWQRPAKEARMRLNPALRKVTNGIVCFCGERFWESQGAEFIVHLRAEVGEDLAILNRSRESHRNRSRERRADPEYRERNNAKLREQRRERRAADPEWRERVNAAQRERRARYAVNPEWRERVNAMDRDRRARRKALADG